MELKVTQEKKNLMLPRRELDLSISSNSAPSYKDITLNLSKKYSLPEENIKVKKVSGKFGSQDFIASVFLYESKKDLDKIEVKTKKQREAEKKAEEERKKTEASKSSESA